MPRETGLVLFLASLAMYMGLISLIARDAIDIGLLGYLVYVVVSAVGMSIGWSVWKG